MPTRLDWNVDTEPAAIELDDLGHSESRPLPTRAWRPSIVTLSAYAGALVAAGWLGFHLGRTSVSEAQKTYGIETALALEEMAWTEADLDLFLATMDPSASGRWRDREANRFVASAPANVALELVDSEDGGEDRVLVRVRVALDGRTYDETRPYRFLGDVWARSEPPYPEDP